MGESGQIDCKPDYEAYYAIDPSPDDDVERDAWLAGGRAFATACAANAGDLLPFLGTENVVSDMEQFREALGEETISFLGISYGTSLGARYADRYPDRVRAFALDSGLPAFIDSATFVPEWVDAIERAFDAYLADCAAALTCAFHSDGDPAAAFDALMARVDATPLEVSTETGTRLVGQRAILDAVDASLSWPSRGPGSSPLWPRRPAGTVPRSLPWPTSVTNGHPTAAMGSWQSGVPGRQLPGLRDYQGASRLRGAGRQGRNDCPPPWRLLPTWTLPCVFWPAPPTPAPHALSHHGAPPIWWSARRSTPRTPTPGRSTWPASSSPAFCCGGRDLAPVLLEQRLRCGCGQRLPARPDSAHPGSICPSTGGLFAGFG